MIKFNNLYEQLERMSELINYNNSFVENDYLIYEGLIKTYPTKHAKNLLERMFLSIGYGKNVFSTKLRIGPVTISPSIEIDSDGTLIVSFLPLRNDIEDTNYMLNYINNLGYFPTVIDYKESGELSSKKVSYDEKFLFELVKKHDFLKQFDVTLEAKFDRELNIDEIPDKLYHITRQDVLHKIKKIGLTPRSELKLSKHPERIYFGKEYSQTLSLVDIFKKEALSRGKEDQKYALLEIDTKLVKHLRVFDDPNYKNLGYYILANVPPNAIKVLKENL